MLRSVLILAPALLAAPAPAQVELAQLQLAQLTVRQRVLIRVPRVPPPRPVEWRERKGPRCVRADQLAGAIVHGRDEIDLVMRGGGRVRARIDGKACHGLGFYSGFYLKPAGDGMVCADRDAFRVRAGATCGIDGFKRLEPKR